MIKKVDYLLITSFIPPFVVTFFIALFVLIMQALWLYIDQIMGKGADIFTIVEMIFYMSVSLIPMALPLATLISSIMVLGNLAERYELVSLKSAGVPLWRIMKPLMFLTLGVSAFSFICSNNLIPISNLKFKSRLHDLKKQKPTFSIEEMAFNDDFDNFVIRVGKKEEDNRSIRNVLIYDQKKTKQGKVSQIVAKEGEMYTTDDDRYFIMHLRGGTQYEEMEPGGRSSANKEEAGKTRYPFIRTNFREWVKVFDLSEFEIEWTDQELFKSHHSMLTSSQLMAAIDSIDLGIQRRKDGLQDYVWRYVHMEMEGDTAQVVEGTQEKSDTVEVALNVNEKPASVASGDTSSQDSLAEASIVDKKQEEKVSSFLSVFSEREQQQLVRRSKVTARSIQAQSENTNRILKKTFEKRVKHVFELNFKFSMALICFIFLFIGAPMGAIIRKGGFGYPILIAILFFMLFVVMNIAFKNVAEKGVMSPVLAAWLPSGVLFPIGIFLTIKAMNDSKLLNLDRYLRIFNWIKDKLIGDKDKETT
jgi:lipopolysaccharide export system permease protein